MKDKDTLVIQTKNMEKLGHALLKAADEQRSKDAQLRCIAHIKQIQEKQDNAHAAILLLKREVDFYERKLAAIRAGEFVLNGYQIVYNNPELERFAG